MGSRLFEPYRTIGLVCDEVPFALERLGKERFVTTSIGRSFLVYDLDKLIVKMVSPPLLAGDQGQEPISALAAKGETTFTACGSDLLEWRRGKLKRRLINGRRRGFGPIVCLLVFGDVLVAATSGADAESPGCLVVLDIKSGRIQRSILIGDEGNDSKNGTTRFSPTCVMHPETYLNKVVVGSAEGGLLLVNIRTGRIVHRFPAAGGGAAVTCITQSPAVDVVGVGLSDGRILVLNLRLDATLMEFVHQGGSVTSVTFRSDSGGPGSAAPFAAMVSGSASGELAVWNLDDRRLASTIRGAHDSAVSRCAFLPNEPLLVTSGADNSLKVFIFDQEDGRGRLLKLRQGHRSPPTRIRYYGGDTLSTLSSGADASCCQILSAGRDRAFRVFHTARDQLNRELSQGSLAKKARNLDIKIEQLKLPPIVDFAATEARQRDWCNVLTAHAGEGTAFTWSLENRTIGDHVLRPDGDVGKLSLRKLNTDKLSAQASKFPAALCVAISACGNLGVVGTADGTVFKYNMQSGLPRGSFPKPGAAAGTKEKRRERRAKRRKLNASSVKLLPDIDPSALDDDEDPVAALASAPDKHDGAVNGVGIDALNSTLFSAGYDGTVRFWDFVQHTLLECVDVGSPLSQLVANRDAGLFAVACDDLRVLVFDTTTRRAIRTFRGHTASITDMAISTDARWLATSSNDTSLRVWDLPTARCVDWAEFSTPVTGLTFAPTGEFLATSFADSVGITLWASKKFFGEAKGDAVARKPIVLQAPTAAAAVESGDNDAAVDAVDVSQFQDDASESDAENGLANQDSSEDGLSDGEEDDQGKPLCEAEHSGEVRLSGQEPSKWYSLALLELIKARNRPVEPAQKPEKAPFFLPTTQAVNPVFKAPAAAGTESKADEKDPLESMNLAQAGDWSDDDEDEGGDADSEADAPAGEQQKPEAPALSRILKDQGFARPRSELFLLLEEAHARFHAATPTGSEEGAAHFRKVVAHLSTLSPSAIDFELRSMTLGPEDDDGGHLLRVTLDWLAAELEARSNFELCQSVLNRVLALHDESIAARPDLVSRVGVVRAAQEAAWKGLRSLIQHSLCLLSFFSHQR